MIEWNGILNLCCIVHPSTKNLSSEILQIINHILILQTLDLLRPRGECLGRHGRFEIQPLLEYALAEYLRLLIGFWRKEVDETWGDVVESVCRDGSTFGWID